MLIATVINSDATLNKFEEIGTLSFIPGYDFTLAIRLKQPQRKDKLRYVAASGATLVATLQKSDSTTLSVTFTAVTGDSSMWTATVAAADNDLLIGGNFTFVLTEGVTTTKGFVEQGLEVVITGDC